MSHALRNRLLNLAPLLMISVLPSVSFAAPKEYNQNLPSVAELYDDCTQALAEADKGNMQAFYNSYCGAQATGIFGASFYALSATPSTSINPTRDEQLIAKGRSDIVNGINKRFCAYKSFSKNETPEIQIARSFIKFIDEERANPQTIQIPTDQYLQSRSPYAMLTPLGLHCTSDKKQ